MRTGKNIAWGFARLAAMGGLVAWLHPRSALRTSGWLRSFNTRSSVDRDGNPIPWFTYPAVDFLSRVDLSALRIFEYGSGASTLWFSCRAREIISVEHDEEWCGRVTGRLSPPHRVLCRPAGERYVHEIEGHGKFDIVVIDGLDRGRCAMIAVEHLNSEGVVIWDDAARTEFAEALPGMLSLGYRPLIFAGMSPMYHMSRETALLYRSGRNCLAI